MLASLTISGAATGVSVAVDATAGVVSRGSESDVPILRGQVIEITLDSGGDDYEGVVTLEVEME